jgi:hypothetical protein
VNQSWIVNLVKPTDGSEHENLLSACHKQYRESMERSWLGEEEILDEPAWDTIHKESLAEVMNTFKSSVMIQGSSNSNNNKPLQTGVTKE